MTTKGVVLAVILSATPVLASAQSTAAQVAQSQAQGEPTAERKGFIVGIGGGAAQHRAPEVTVTRDRFGRLTFSSALTNNLAVATDFRIGYAPTDQFLIYYSNKAAFTQAADYDVAGITGAGVTYMARRTSPTLFVNGIVGIGFGGTFIERIESENGAGFGVGGGYEFTRHLSIAGDVLFVRLPADSNHRILMATFNYLFY